MKAIIEKASEESVLKAGQILKAGGLVAFPTETVYGLGANFTDASAVRRIFAAKGRDEGKPLSILVSSVEQIYPYAVVSEAAQKLIAAFWPGPLTIVFALKSDANIPKEVTAGGTTVGFRMPSCETTLKIIAAAGTPLAAPSANVSGKRSAVCAEDAAKDLGESIDMIVDGGPCSIGISSTVVDVSNGKVKLLRAGSISEKEISGVIDINSYLS